MDWKALEADTAAAVKTALSDLRATYPGEVFYACAVYTDSGAMTLGVAANSQQALERKLDREAEAERSELRPYYTWCTSEWAYEAWRGECFRAVCMDLASAEPKEDFGVFRERLSQLMIDVLAGLRSQGFFEAVFSEVPVLFVTVTDDAGAEGLEDRSARVLNTEAVFREFVQRYPAIIV
ncbi:MULTISPECIES: DUF4303 domain-containing protein [Pseudomonas]|uniref:DUF4303 domain-containing protein n=1 Tax=Pseudomonas TaxID=286 RepID=UPI00218B167E|nr:DUF4303 domain-containing protein [Pseudomonas sp. LRP2-20]BDM22773.1 DUF4303 domain-containing protein [Pseudomonas sp. LRP2-20]